MSQFSHLCEGDKITLLKSGCPKIINLLSVLNFNFEGKFWTVPFDNENAVQLSLDLLLERDLFPTEIHYKFMQNIQQECNSDLIMLDLL
ncbi:unnamed protein product [Oppiella nova]|uniref:Uncharacterized protein n=1 Tax=Oppiella nova TaxID=334625 RepID=A0A7R9M491_9ACAR|nr:unnamed protein product [Oppiella nova]CAG2169974.1 unnamed protein product [Oppiella nova]